MTLIHAILEALLITPMFTRRLHHSHFQHDGHNSVEEMIVVSVQNSASIGRYEARESTLNVTVYQDREDATDRKIKRWEHYDTYKNPSRTGAVKQLNGYWTISADNINKAHYRTH